MKPSRRSATGGNPDVACRSSAKSSADALQDEPRLSASTAPSKGDGLFHAPPQSRRRKTSWAPLPPTASLIRTGKSCAADGPPPPVHAIHVSPFHSGSLIKLPPFALPTLPRSRLGLPRDDGPHGGAWSEAKGELLIRVPVRLDLTQNGMSTPSIRSERTAPRSDREHLSLLWQRLGPGRIRSLRFARVLSLGGMPLVVLRQFRRRTHHLGHVGVRRQ